MIFTTLYSPKGLWSEDITVWGTFSHVSLNVRSLIRVFAILIFMVLRRFGVDLASIVFGNRRHVGVME